MKNQYSWEELKEIFRIDLKTGLKLVSLALVLSGIFYFMNYQAGKRKSYTFSYTSFNLSGVVLEKYNDNSNHGFPTIKI